jgi:transaldolase / glucose-6-phosphate isomerase
MNPLRNLLDYGQSVWLDYIRRNLITGGELKRLINEDGLRGVTSNPAIFEKAIAGSTDYIEALAALEKQKDVEPMALYEQLAIKDIQDAADTLRSVYDSTKKRDGYVSLEVSPYLANDTKSTIDEARRLWKAIGRPNVLIKVPATDAGIPAIRTLISEGININVTLLFAQTYYEAVADAYIGGLAERARKGADVSGVASVASFFVSRIDTLIDSIVSERIKKVTSAGERARLQSLQGKIAIASAKLAYQKYKEICRSKEWLALEGKGAHTQRLLWASTSTKNPAYPDVMYVEELIGPDTVNTIPPATLDAFRDHGKLRASLESQLTEAHDAIQTLERVGISLKDATDQLQQEGVKLFADAFDKLLVAVDRGRRAQLRSNMDRVSYKLPADLGAKVKAALEDWRANGKVRRLWARDASLWTSSDESNWLGWLGIADEQVGHIGHLKAIGEEAREGGFTHTLLLGMGGSSLCPEVMKATFGKRKDYPELFVLDSTDPAQIKAVESKINLAKTLFIVSSKSGTTLEPNIFKQYFFDRAQQALGSDAARHFIAVTDPRSKMQQVAESDGFRHVFFGVPSIGGRYSALSHFGMVPAAVMGVDVERFLNDAELMVHSCAASVPPEDNPGVLLGAIMGVLASGGRDKVTIIASPAIYDLGAWLEQLLAESTGKVGKGIIPVDREQLGTPGVYGNDRLFVYLRLESAPDPKQDAAVDALEKAGHPVVKIEVEDIYDLGQEFFRWEIATAVAGSIIGINPFNQPDVEASKVETRKLTDEYEKTGSLPPEQPMLEADGVKLYADPRNSAELAKAAGSDKSLAGYLKAHLGRIRAGDYFATLAYVQMNDEHRKELQSLRHAVRDNKKVATCLGFGPRFLHSTGQAYKGGPNSGVFLQVTCDDANDIAVPGQKFTFGLVKAAQARGDFAVLAERGRRALRVHIGKDVGGGLAALRRAVEKAL